VSDLHPWHRPTCLCPECHPLPVESFWRQAVTLVLIFLAVGALLWWVPLEPVGR